MGDGDKMVVSEECDEARQPEATRNDPVLLRALLFLTVRPSFFKGYRGRWLT